MNNVAILILAGGASSRMGEPKQLLKLGNKTMLSSVITKVLDVKNQDTFVVLGANYSKIERLFKGVVSCVVNNNWSKGIGTSISCGVAKLMKSNKYMHVVIVLADQPGIEVCDLNKLLEVHKKEKSKITVSSFINYRGVPAVFHKDMFSDLVLLSDDEGAKSVIKKYQDQVLEVVFNKELLDIDTVDDYQKMLNSLNTLS